MDKKFFQILAAVSLSLTFHSNSAECRGYLGPDINLQHIPAYMACWSHCKEVWEPCLTGCGYEVPQHDNSFNLPGDYTPKDLCVSHCYNQREQCNTECIEAQNK